MELVELIRGAQDAMDRGDYAHTAAACTHALDTYPSCFAAHRMLAEALLEQGRADAAIEHFDRTLALDPLNVVARLGLGVASEEKRDAKTAYAAYLNAWEINPALDQVRDELVRLRGLLGGDERLHPTRAGLAGIYARGGQYGRAAAEWRAVLTAEPENVRARTALAEILWRSGDDVAAAAACREVLHAFPENARALAMLSEIEQRRGGVAAAELVDRYHAVDPLGEIAALLAEWREGTDVTVLRRESASLPDFDPSVATAQDFAEPPRSTGELAPSHGLSGGHFAAPDLWDTIVKDLGTDALNAGAAPPPPDGLQPFSWQDDAGVNGLPDVEPFSLDALAGATASVPDDLRDALPPAVAASTPMPLDVAIPAMAPAAAELSPAVIGPGRAGSLELDDVSESRDEPVSAAKATVDPIAVAPSRTLDAGDNGKFVTADGRVDLTVGWDDLDRQLREATPNFDDTAEIDALAAALGVDGIVPFDMGENPFDASAWAPFTDDDLGAGNVSTEPVASAPATPEPGAALGASSDAGAEDVEPEPALAGWDLDVELVSAIPAQQPTGYTEMLRHVDIEVPLDVDADGDLNPFANPDTSGDPLAFEDLLAVTSRDGTAPLAAPGDPLPVDLPAAEMGDDLSPGVIGEAGFEEAPSEAAAGFAGSEPVTWPVGRERAANHAPVEDVTVDGPLDQNPDALEALLRGEPVLAGEDASGTAMRHAFETVETLPVASEAGAKASGEGSGADQTGPLEVADGAEGPDVAPPAIPVLGDMSDEDLAATFAELGDLQPFSLDEMAPAGVSGEVADVVDFSDINEAPFDPESLSRIINPAAQAPILADWAVEAEAEETESEAGEQDATAGWHEDESQAGAVDAQGGDASPALEVAARRNGDGFGVRPGTIAWPAFVSHTSELIDRGPAGGTLFARLRDSKRAAVASGLLTVDRSIMESARKREDRDPEPVDERVQVIAVPGPEPARASGGTGLTESERIDLMAMRVRLIEDAESAEEVASVLEGAVTQGLADPLALRVLGEAYLKLGRTEQAAAQFRQAMLARRRAR